MPDYSKISKTLKKLNLSHLEETFKAYRIHDYVVLSLTSDQLRRFLPNHEGRFRSEFMILCANDEEVSEEVNQGDRQVQVESNTENRFSNPFSQQEMPESDQVASEGSHEDKSTQTGNSIDNNGKVLPTSTESNKKTVPKEKPTSSKSTGMSAKTKKNLKTAGIIGASVLGASALAVVAALVAIAAAGFGSAGVVAGSLAATWQATMGGYIAASSLFATLQSVGAVGLSAAASASIGVGGAVVGGATATGIVALTNKAEKKDQDDHQPIKTENSRSGYVTQYTDESDMPYTLTKQPTTAATAGAQQNESGL